MPKVLQMADKMRPFITDINKYRYFMAEGGRGGGKSQALARIILYLGDQRKLRIVCGRETQNSIAESVYSLMCDIIREYNLPYDILSTKIRHKESGTVINFRGFREVGSFNIQGMENCSIVWVDEAQALTTTTLQRLIPTIRRDDAKLFFTMNRHEEHDPVYEFLYGREDCCHVHLNYYDNPFCTQALKDEAEVCKAKSDKDYRHIWLGEPLLQLEDAVFTYRELKDTVTKRHDLKDAYGYRIAGFDIARYGDDQCAAVVLQQRGALHWEMIYVDTWDHTDLNYTSGRILTTSVQQHADRNVIDEDGMGAGNLDTLRHGRGLDNFVGFKNLSLGYDKDKQYGNCRTRAVYKLKEMVTNGHMVITDEDTIRELCTLKYKYDHYQRKILISKDVMRSKFNIKSPNMADALIMAVDQIGNIRYDQETIYQTRQPAYYKEDNLFNTAGVI